MLVLCEALPRCQISPDVIDDERDRSIHQGINDDNDCNHFDEYRRDLYPTEDTFRDMSTRVNDLNQMTRNLRAPGIPMAKNEWNSWVEGSNPDACAHHV
jgi:hypothetical protein